MSISISPTYFNVNREVVHIIRPLEDERWAPFVQRQPGSSVFHTIGWLEALRKSYGYTPYAITTSAPGSPLEDAWTFCGINSWITGRRWVSLPFSDHCEPLGEIDGRCQRILDLLGRLLGRDRLRYFEVRLAHSNKSTHLRTPPSLVRSSLKYCFHSLDLSPDIDSLFRNCHKNSTQRKIHRAQREGLHYEEGRSSRFIDAFFHLQLITRRRHGLPPQPKAWFRNIIECLGDNAKIRVAYKDNDAVAAILTIQHKTTLMYKYGCSDARLHHLGGMHLLFWKTIEEGKKGGLSTLDLGRSDPGNVGLITFKDRWGGKRSTLTYSRFMSATSPRVLYSQNFPYRQSRGLLSYVPRRLFGAAGRLFYRHIG